MPTIRQRIVSSITRQYPFYSGCGTFANHPFIHKLAGASHESAWAHVPGGEVLAPLDDFVGRAAYYAGELDRKLTWICSRLVRRGDTVLDIGANIGLVTVLLAMLAGKEGQVHAFEPNPRLVHLLRQVIDRNHLGNVKLHSIALGPEPGDLELRIPKLNSGAASLVRNRDIPDCEVIKVEVRQLDTVAAHEDIRSVRLIKIDVEGYESEVFRGADTLLRTVRPDAILFELNEQVDGPFAEVPVIKLLLQYDYGFLSIPRAFIRMRLRPFDPLGSEKPPGHDFLAVAHGDRFQDILSRMQVNG